MVRSLLFRAQNLRERDFHQLPAMLVMDDVAALHRVLARSKEIAGYVRNGANDLRVGLVKVRKFQGILGSFNTCSPMKVKIE